MPDVIAFTTGDPIDVAALTESARRDSCGAVVVFEGNVRSPNQGSEVERLDYEVYERVADDQLKAIADEVAQRLDLTAVVAVHRTGPVPTGETALLVAVSCSHRQNAFAGSALIVDRIKAEVAIWKDEISVIQGSAQ